MITAYQGIVQNGQIHFDDNPELPEGSQVIVVVVEEEQTSVEKKTLLLSDLLESPVVGMWADRDDISNGAEFARQLRERASKRDA